MQDTAAYHGKQQNGSLQITAGYGASINGNYGQSNIRAEHETVTEQSGIYAGEDGYQIYVGTHTDLEGGLITSTPSVEDNCKNRFSTDTLTFSDLHNHSAYQGESLGVDTEIAVIGRTLGQESPNAPGSRTLHPAMDRNGVGHSVANWQRGQVLLNSIAAELSAPTQSAVGIASATALPMISY